MGWFESRGASVGNRCCAVDGLKIGRDAVLQNPAWTLESSDGVSTQTPRAPSSARSQSSPDLSTFRWGCRLVKFPPSARSLLPSPLLPSISFLVCYFSLFHMHSPLVPIYTTVERVDSAVSLRCLLWSLGSEVSLSQ
jgi:hypothetical protein